MSGDDHALTAFQAWQNGFVQWNNAVNGQRQALGGWQLSVGQFRVTRVVARIALVIFGQLWWGYREAATPLFNLLVTVLLSGFGFSRPCSAP